MIPCKVKSGAYFLASLFFLTLRGGVMVAQTPQELHCKCNPYGKQDKVRFLPLNQFIAQSTKKFPCKPTNKYE